MCVGRTASYRHEARRAAHAWKNAPVRNESDQTCRRAQRSTQVAEHCRLVSLRDGRWHTLRRKQLPQGVLILCERRKLRMRPPSIAPWVTKPVLCSAQRTTAAPVNKARAGSASGLHLDGFDMRHARTLVDRTKQ